MLIEIFSFICMFIDSKVVLCNVMFTLVIIHFELLKDYFLSLIYYLSSFCFLAHDVQDEQFFLLKTMFSGNISVTLVS